MRTRSLISCSLMFTVMNFVLSDQISHVSAIDIGVYALWHLSERLLWTRKLQKFFSEVCLSMNGLKRYHLLITLWNHSLFTVSISAMSFPWEEDGHLLCCTTSLIASCVWRKIHLLLFPGVNEMRRERLPWAPQDCVWVVWLLPLPLSGISNIAVFEVLGWVPPFSALMQAGVVLVVQLWQPFCKFLLLYLHTEQTGNCVHLYANVFVPKADILN